MAGIRDIKNRIKSTNSTKQITRAMNLVSTAKLKRARDRVEGVRPYFNELQTVVKDIVSTSAGVENEYMKAREVEKTLIIVITADRGLCGGYNANSIKKAIGVSEDKEAAFVTVGVKARDYFRKRNYDVQESFTNMSESVNFKNAKSVSGKAMELYKLGAVDEVYLVYNKFISTIQFEPTAIKLLPLSMEDMLADSGEKKEKHGAPPLYEPSPEEVLNLLIPKYITGTVYGAMLEAAASEQSSRMTAMSSATDNATEMINELTLFYNRARQASITREISEIIGGAEALK